MEYNNVYRRLCTIENRLEPMSLKSACMGNVILPVFKFHQHLVFLRSGFPNLIIRYS